MPPIRSLLIERFKRLPRRSNDVWQGGVVRARTWIDEPDGKVRRPWAAVWVSLATGMMNVQLAETDAASDPNLSLHTLVDLGLKFARSRPARLAVTDGALGVGLAQASFEAALRYAQQRTAFGKPINQHQAIQLKLADMATAVTAARLLVHDAGVDPIRSVLAKLQASAAATRVTLESMRTHGGYGYTAEFPVERHYRDAARLLAMPIPEDAARAIAAARLRAADDRY